jgi:hypothetical protein
MMQEDIATVANENVGGRTLSHGKGVTEVGREERFVIGQVPADLCDMFGSGLVLTLSEPTVNVSLASQEHESTMLGIIVDNAGSSQETVHE